MDFTPGQQKLLAYWGEIQSAVSQRVSTAALWETVRVAAAQEGRPLSGVGAIDMNLLRSIAAEQQRTMGVITAGRLDQTITADMIARDLSSRALADQNLAPRFLVRFQHDVIVDGQLQTLWRSSFFDGSLPSTKGDLLNALTQDAVAMSDDYGVTHAGVGQFQISAV